MKSTPSALLRLADCATSLSWLARPHFYRPAEPGRRPIQPKYARPTAAAAKVRKRTSRDFAEAAAVHAK